MTDISRRDLLKGAAVAGAGLAASGAFLPAIAENVSALAHPDAAPPAPAARTTMKGVPFERHDVVRFGIVGTGLRGRSDLNELLSIEGVKVVKELLDEKDRRIAALEAQLRRRA